MPSAVLICFREKGIKLGRRLNAHNCCVHHRFRLYGERGLYCSLLQMLLVSSLYNCFFVSYTILIKLS